MTDLTSKTAQRICQLCGATWQEYSHICGDGGRAPQPEKVRSGEWVDARLKVWRARLAEYEHRYKTGELKYCNPAAQAELRLCIEELESDVRGASTDTR